jgi:hypothetical protein
LPNHNRLDLVVDFTNLWTRLEMCAALQQLFISHSSANRQEAESLRNLLRDQDFESLFLDCHPEDGLQVAEQWEQRLYVALKQCDVVLVLDTEAWRRSKWCFAEFAIARSLGKHVMVVQPPYQGGCRNRSATKRILPDRQGFQVRKWTATDCQPLFESLRRFGVQTSERFPWDLRRSPYPGLAPLETDDAAVFFGRTQECRDVIDLLERNGPLRRKGPHPAHRSLRLRKILATSCWRPSPNGSPQSLAGIEAQAGHS